MGTGPIKLRLDGDELHLVPTRDLERWSGPFHARRSAFELVTPHNIAILRGALMVPRWVDTEGVFDELRKQLEDDSALFFEFPPQPVAWDAPETTDIRDLIRTGGDPITREPTRPSEGEHFIEVVCIAADGKSFAGAQARVRLPDGRTEFVTLDARSSVLLEDLSEGGTAHFELSGDAQAHGTLDVPQGTRYELGGTIGLVTGRAHVLLVHPNPLAFVSVGLFVHDTPVIGGNYTLTTALGDQSGALDGEPARAEGFALPSTASYSFEHVILPPREPDPGGGTDPGGGGGGTDPGGGGGGGTDPTLGRSVSLEVLLGPDDTPLANTEVRIVVDGVERTAITDANGMVSFDDLPEGVTEVEAFITGPSALSPPEPPPQPED